MISDSLKKMDEMPHKSMLLVAAVLVIVCQLVAMALVVDGQVKRAEARDSALDSQRIAVFQCNESGSVATRQSCIQQAMGALSALNQPKVSNQVQAMAISGALERGEPSTATAQGFMAASYTLH